MDLRTVTKKGVRYPDRKRVGRGPGSGLGKTSARGHKGWGQRSGTSRRPGYEGGQMPIYRRVPKRGFTNARFRTDYTIVNVEQLDVFKDGDTVDLAAVLEKGLTSKVSNLLKVLGDGKLERKLTVRAQKFSKSAAEKIAQAGGTTTVLSSAGRDAGDEQVVQDAKDSNAASKRAAKQSAADKRADKTR